MTPGKGPVEARIRYLADRVIYLTRRLNELNSRIDKHAERIRDLERDVQARNW